MKTMKNIPSPDQALSFYAYCQKWQVLLGLMDWRIVLIDRLAKEAMACVTFDDDARMAVLRLGDWGAHTITDEALESTAIHELLHILLHDLVVDNKGEASGMLEHRVINVLEKLLSTKDPDA